jgi:hypothetical protein
MFLRTLAKTPSVTVACKAADVNRRTAYDRRDRDPEFAAKWDDALNQSLDVLEHEVYQRAAYLNPRPFDIPWMVFDTAPAAKEWHWQVETPLERILEEIADHAATHPNWLELSAP